MNDDLQHLQILSILHYVVGGLIGLVACFPLIHFCLGIMMLSGGLDSAFGGRGGPAPPAFFGWIFVVIPALMISAGWTVAVLVVLAGRFLSHRTHHLYCTVMAGVECCFMPFGTILGVFTLIVLLRPSVKMLFGQDFRPEAPVTAAPVSGAE